MYLAQETLTRRFTLRRALQHDQHSLDGEVIGHRALVEFMPRKRMHGAVHRGQKALIHCGLGSVKG
jgi:hypothetical protein